MDDAAVRLGEALHISLQAGSVALQRMMPTICNLISAYRIYLSIRRSQGRSPGIQRDHARKLFGHDCAGRPPGASDDAGCPGALDDPLPSVADKASALA